MYVSCEDPKDVICRDLNLLVTILSDRLLWFHIFHTVKLIIILFDLRMVQLTSKFTTRLIFSRVFFDFVQGTSLNTHFTCE